VPACRTGREKGSIPASSIAVPLVILAADFFTNNLKNGELPDESDPVAYEKFIQALRQSNFFRALNQFNAGHLSAEQVYQVMRGLKNLDAIKQSTVRALRQLLDDHLRLLRSMLQTLIAA